jgi:hypothetical protein
VSPDPNNFGLGAGALETLTTGNNNVAVGQNTLNAFDNPASPSNPNTAIGYAALFKDTTGVSNVAVGTDALFYNLSATSSTAIGYLAGSGNSSGYSNQGGTAVGYQAGTSFQTGSDYNTLLGYDSGYSLTTGNHNIFLGDNSTQGNASETTGSSNIKIGDNITLPSGTASNQLDIGNLIYGTGLNGTGSTLSTGNVGIGTTTPWGLLSVQSPSTYSSNPVFVVASSTTNDLFVVQPTGNIGIGVSNPTNASLEIAGSSVGGRAIYVNRNAQSGSNPVMEIDDQSNNTGATNQSSVLITRGATGSTLGWALQVEGLNNRPGALYASSTISQTSSEYTENLIGGSGTSGATGNIIALEVTGNQAVTSGSGTYTGLLVNPTINQSGTASGNYTGLLVNPTETNFLGTDGRLLDVQLGGSSKFLIKDTGDVGIGTTTPDAELTVSANTGMIFPDNNVFEIASSTAAASTTLFSVANTGNATLAGTLTQNSDERLKTNIQSLDASSSLAAIDSLNPVLFNWADDIFGSTNQLGFLAQQVQTIFPQLVSTTSPTALTPGGTLGLNYTGLIAPIVSAIQSIADIGSTFQQNLVAWLGNAENGITDFFAENIHAQNELCVGSTCVTPAQFQAMVAAANRSGASAQPSAAGASQTPESVSQSNPQNSSSTSPISVSSSGTSTTTQTTSQSGQGSTPPEPPQIQINGDNPATINVGATYTDLGAAITGPTADLNLGLTTYVNGTKMNPVQINTTQAATDTIEYVATDQSGLTSTSTRTVIVQAPANDNQATSTAANDNSQPLAATGTNAASTNAATPIAQ